MTKSYSKFDKEYSYFCQSRFEIFLEKHRQKNGKRKCSKGAINNYISKLKNTFPIINGIKSHDSLFNFLKEKCRSDMTLNQQQELVLRLKKENQNLTGLLNKVEDFLYYLDKKMDDEKVEGLDAYNSLLKIFDKEDERKSIEKFVKLVIENCYFFSKQLVNESFEKIKSGIKGENNIALPSRESNRSIYYPNKNIKKGDEVIFLIPDKDKSFNNKERLKVRIDDNGNQYIQNLLKNTFKNYSFSNYIISHIWGKAIDPRFFSALWNIVLVPSYANALLDKKESKDGLNVVGSYLLNTIKAIITQYYSLEDKNWNELYLTRPDYILKRVILDKFNIQILSENGTIEHDQIELLLPKKIKQNLNEELKTNICSTNYKINMEENALLKRYIQTTGMGTFVDLVPFIMKDPDVTVLDLTRLFPNFSRYSAQSQITKLTNAKAIFKHNWEIEALKIIADSYRVGPVVRLRAKELLAEYD